ncbi:MAG: hypothetical protein ACTSO7_10070 [Candidatus Heimdallarchaeota archaeon]
MSEKIAQDDEALPEMNFRYYLRVYLAQKILLLPLLIASFILVDIVVLFISVNYTFIEMFYLCGIIMILIVIGSSIIILFERSPLSAYIAALIFGLVPIIEIIIHITMVPQDIASLILAILSIVLAIGVICFLIVYVPLYQNKKKAEKTEG